MLLTDKELAATLRRYAMDHFNALGVDDAYCRTFHLLAAEIELRGDPHYFTMLQKIDEKLDKLLDQVEP